MLQTKYIGIRASFVVCLILVGLATLSSEPDISISQIDTYLSQKVSPLAGTGRQHRDAGLAFQVDPRLVVAIAGAETTFGKRLCAPNNNNAWNWFWCKRCSEATKCSGSPFASWDEGIATVTKFLKKSYLEKGRTTFPKIAEIYCVRGCDDWVELVSRFYATELNGEEANLHFVHP